MQLGLGHGRQGDLEDARACVLWLTTNSSQFLG